MNSENLLNIITQEILNIKCDHPVRVAIDGTTAAGKSTFALALVKNIKSSDRNVISTTLDGFHNKSEIRHKQGRMSAEGYFRDAYNYKAISSDLLIPLGPDGNLLYKTEVFDLKTNTALNGPAILADKNLIVIVDGSFALRKELKDYWEYKLYLKVDYDIAAKRAAIRDRELFGSSKKALEVTKARYHEAHKIHEKESNLEKIADHVINNNDPLNPSFISSEL